MSAGAIPVSAGHNNAGHFNDSASAAAHPPRPQYSIFNRRRALYTVGLLAVAAIVQSSLAQQSLGVGRFVRRRNLSGWIGSTADGISRYISKGETKATAETPALRTIPTEPADPRQDAVVVVAAEESPSPAHPPSSATSAEAVKDKPKDDPAPSARTLSDGTGAASGDTSASGSTTDKTNPTSGAAAPSRPSSGESSNSSSAKRKRRRAPNPWLTQQLCHELQDFSEVCVYTGPVCVDGLTWRVYVSVPDGPMTGSDGRESATDDRFMTPKHLGTGQGLLGLPNLPSEAYADPVGYVQSQRIDVIPTTGRLWGPEMRWTATQVRAVAAAAAVVLRCDGYIV